MRYLVIFSAFIAQLAFGQAFTQHDLPFLAGGAAASTGRPTITGFTATFIGDMDANYLTNSSGVNPPASLDSIKDWGDQSGNFFTLRQLGGSTIGPQYVSNGGGPNGGPYLQFRANSNSDLTNKVVSKSQQTIVFLVARDLDGSSTCTISGGSGQVTELYYAIPNLHMASGSDVSVGPAPASSTWNVHTLVFDGASSHYRTNGVDAIGAFNSGSSGVSGITVGAFFNGTGPSIMRMVELDIYNGNVSPSVTEMHTYEVYLGAKYGITIH